MTGFEWPAAKIILKYVGGFALLLLLLGSCYIKGRNDGHDLAAAQTAIAKAEWQTKIADLQYKSARKTDLVREEYNNVADDLREELAALKKNPKIITRYVPATVDTLVPKGMVELHNRAATGASLADDVVDAETPSQTKLSIFGSVVTENYLVCSEEKKRLESLQKIVKSFQDDQKGLRDE